MLYWSLFQTLGVSSDVRQSYTYIPCIRVSESNHNLRTKTKSASQNEMRCEQVNTDYGRMVDQTKMHNIFLFSIFSLLRGGVPTTTIAGFLSHRFSSFNFIIFFLLCIFFFNYFFILLFIWYKYEWKYYYIIFSYLELDFIDLGNIISILQGSCRSSTFYWKTRIFGEL